VENSRLGIKLLSLLLNHGTEHQLLCQEIFHLLFINCQDIEEKDYMLER